MRQLQVLGVSEDGEALLLGPTAGKPSHRLRLDDKLRAAVRGQLSAVSTQRAESALSPKDMQSRLREGATPEQVAKEAGIPVARVLPYAAPVIAERERIVEQARGAVLHRSRGPNGQRPLGDVVDAHLAEAAGLKPESVDWTARRRKDGAWVVGLTYAARGGRRTASWLWRPLERDLTALDTSASRLAAEEAPAAKRAGAANRRPAKKRVAKKATGKRPAAKKAATAKRPVTKAAAARSVAKATAKTSTARKATVKKPAAKAPTIKAAAVRTPTVKKAAPKPVRAKRRATPPRPTIVPAPVVEVVEEIVEPTPIVVIRPDPEPEHYHEPEHDHEPEQVAAPVAARRAGQRVPLPSWSDVLLGVAPRESSRDVTPRRRRKSG